MAGEKEYQRISAAINYLRNGDSVRAGIKAWRHKNKDRHKYLRQTGVAYLQQRRKYADLTPEQKKSRYEAVQRCEAKSPQRRIRRTVDRTVQLCIKRLSRLVSNGLNLSQLVWPAFTRYTSLSPGDFVEYFQPLLDSKGWTWGDHGTKWTIDHIVPVRNFSLPQDICSCWHYTNLRPLERLLNHRGYRN